MANPNPQTPAARKAVRGRRARSAGNVAPTPEERHRMIAEAAYFRALRRTDGDGDPLTDDPDPDAPGHDAVLIRAVAYAGYSVRRRLEAVARRDGGVVRLAAWREIR